MGSRQESLIPPPEGCNVDDYVEVRHGPRLGFKGKVLKVEDRWSGNERDLRWKVQLSIGMSTWADEVVPTTKEEAEKQAAEEAERQKQEGHLAADGRLSVRNSVRTKGSGVTGVSEVYVGRTASGTSSVVAKINSKADDNQLVRTRTRAISEAAALGQDQDEADFTFQNSENHRLAKTTTQASIVYSPVASEKSGGTMSQKRSLVGGVSTTVSMSSLERNHLSPGRSTHFDIAPLAHRPGLVSKGSQEFANMMQDKRHGGDGTSSISTMSMGLGDHLGAPEERRQRPHSADPTLESRISLGPSRERMLSRERGNSKTSLLDPTTPLSRANSRGARPRATSDHHGSPALGKKLSLPGGGSSSPRNHKHAPP